MAKTLTTQYEKISEAIRYLVQHRDSQPTLEDVAGQVYMSPFHLQRIFAEWAGVSPKQFLKYLTVNSLKQSLHAYPDLATASESAGLTSTSRLHELFVSMEACTPAEYRSGGTGLEFEYGFAESVFGDCFVAGNQRGIAALSFSDGNRAQVLSEFRVQWPNATLVESDGFARKHVDMLNQLFSPLTQDEHPPRFRVLVKGTPFQIKVWEALLGIPAGQVSSYQKIAIAVGNPKASRAVGSAVGSNPVSWLIPCHRVIRQEGVIGNYHWDPIRKTAMLGLERVRFQE